MAFGATMRLSLKYDLPFTTIILCYLGETLEVKNVLIDTGSASSIFAADVVRCVNISPLPDDKLYSIRGVGGSETVFSRKVDYIEIGGKRFEGLEIEVGGMDYGFEINGILGMDFLVAAGAIINLQDMQISFE
jgi:predicted aspartyl protease